MKKLITSVMLVGMGLMAHAQQDAQFSQNFFTRLDYNPAYAGMSQAYCGGLIYRNQWIQFPGSPTTINFNGDAYLPMIGGGAGLTVYDDKLGFQNNLEAKLSYSYHLILGPGVLGIGLSAGFYQMALSGNWMTPDGHSQSAGNINDPLVPVGGNTVSTYDIGFGLYYATPQGLYVGISTSHLPAQTIQGSYQQYQYDIARHYFIMAGYTYNASATWDLKPDVYVESDASSTQAQLDLRAEWSKTIWFGAGYRLNDAFVFLLGYKKAIGQGELQIGCSYDLTTSDIHTYSSGTFELGLQYCFTPKPPSKIEYHQNPRFL
ncbi:MAG: type IX secretion system membrane protein PorP/SprF [Bacteroidia bacterium]